MPAIHFGYGHQRDWQPYNVDTANASITPNYYESYGTQKVVFDGPNRLILVDENVTDLDIREDVYEAWKEWVRNPDLTNAEYLPAIRGVGGDPISGTTDQFVGDLYFLINNWRLVYDPRRVAVTGVLFSDDFTTAFYFDEPFKYDTPEFLDPVFPAKVSSIVNTYEIASSLTSEEIASSVWDAVSSSYVTIGTMGELQNEIANIRTAAGATPAEIVAEMDANSTSLSNIYSLNQTIDSNIANITVTLDNVQVVVGNIDSNVIIVDNKLDNLTTTVNTIDGSVQNIETLTNDIDSELGLVAADVINVENIVTSMQTVVNNIDANVINLENLIQSQGGALTPTQATMLLEMYELLGLDPTKPLIVTQNARTAGNISQTIATTSTQTTVSRN